MRKRVDPSIRHVLPAATALATVLTLATCGKDSEVERRPLELAVTQVDTLVTTAS